MGVDEWRVLRDFVQAFATPLIAIVMFFLRRVLQKQDETHHMLREQNGRLTKLEIRVGDHIDSDREMFHAIRGEINRVALLRGVPPS